MPRRKMPEHDRDFEKMNKTEALDRVLEDYKKAEQFHTDKHDKIMEYYQAYRNYVRPDKLKTGRSNLFIPHTMTNIETLKSKVINAIFSERPFVSTKVLDVSDSEEAELKSKAMNNFLQYQFEQKMGIIPLANVIVLEELIAGVAITKQSWKFKEKKVKRRSAQKDDTDKDVKNAPTTKEKTIVTHDHPTMRLVQYDMFFPDPAGMDINTSRYVIEKEFMDYSELIGTTDFDQAEVKKLKSDKDSFSMDENKQLESVGYVNNTKDSRKDIEVLHYWTDDWHIAVGNRKVVLVSEENPYYHMEKPYSKWEYLPVPGQWWGVSAVEMMYNLQMELNTHRNQRVDNVSFILNKMHKIKRGSNIREEDLISRPGGTITVDEMDDIEEMEFKDVTASAFNEEAIIKKDMDSVIGVHEVNRGGTAERRETATMASITDQNANERFTTTIKMVEFGGFKDAVAQIIQLNQQFITEDTPYLSPGEQGEFNQSVMKEEDVLNEYELVGIGKSIGYLSNRDVKQNQLANLMNTLAPYAQYVNIPVLLEKVFKTYEISEAEKLIIANPPPQPQPQPQGGQPMDPNTPMGGAPQGMPQGQPQPEQGGQDQMLQQVVGQIVQVIEQETQGQINPETLIRLIVDIIQGNPPQEPQLQPLVQRVMELFQQFVQEAQGGGMGQPPQPPQPGMGGM